MVAAPSASADAPMAAYPQGALKALWPTVPVQALVPVQQSAIRDMQAYRALCGFFDAHTGRKCRDYDIRRILTRAYGQAAKHLPEGSNGRDILQLRCQMLRDDLESSSYSCDRHIHETMTMSGTSVAVSPASQLYSRTPSVKLPALGVSTQCTEAGTMPRLGLMSSGLPDGGSIGADGGHLVPPRWPSAGSIELRSKATGHFAYYARLQLKPPEPRATSSASVAPPLS